MVLAALGEKPEYGAGTPGGEDSKQVRGHACSKGYVDGCLGCNSRISHGCQSLLKIDHLFICSTQCYAFDFQLNTIFMLSPPPLPPSC